MPAISLCQKKKIKSFKSNLKSLIMQISGRSVHVIQEILDRKMMCLCVRVLVSLEMFEM